ncbi:oligopeptide/dipeptide ABC transporter ATP-binding protein [Frankia sp. AgKG'84/4]|uniref:oligopeptide/dipeptide ABC transporter ATP-binding protein n=1 Tax=Frankia sp. AgKG'84/4 TaxID=573490 RepID=UPI00200D9CBE|nr:ABC transporter ATP-binding protein [Frankia sp. AgKG'84/4]MCL9797181.1 ABC transporter ATP-binding protein [Frankia sp. AgKG'84/4]
MTTTVLTVSGLTKRFRVAERGRARWLTAVDGIDLAVTAGRTLALVGESGSGKSTVARCVARLVEPDAGEVRLGDRSVSAMSRARLRAAYGEIQLVFQDPNSALNPRLTVGAALDEPLRLHTGAAAPERRARIDELLADVRLDPHLIDRYPRQLSGGQRQRVVIARALAVRPTFLLLDEPTASLDVSVRRQVLALLRRLQREHGLGYLLISHDLAAVRQLGDEIAVMYLGRIVERGLAAEVLDRPTHPYTRALLSAAPVAEYGRTRTRFRLRGEIPSAVDLPRGCRLVGRCPLAEPSCDDGYPPTVALSATHTVDCPITAGAPSSPKVTLAP